MTYHFVVVLLSVMPWSSTCSHVPTGVSAFHDETSSVKPKPGASDGDVQVPATAAIGP